MLHAQFKGKPRYVLTERDGVQVWRDMKDRILFDRSPFIPGNGKEHRLGPTKADVAKPF